MTAFTIFLLPAIVNVIESTRCQPGRVYCAYELKLKIKFWPPHRIRIKCGDDGQINEVLSMCYSNCTHRGDGRDAFCQCQVGAKYCAHELRLLGMKGYANNATYACVDGGSNVSLVEQCTEGCVAHGPSASCTGGCVPRGYYCGHQLTAMSLGGYDNNTIYQCRDDRHSLNNVTVCSNECVQTDEPHAYCRCRPGRLYCAWQLPNIRNWSIYPPPMRNNGKNLLRCHTSGEGADMTAAVCENGCTQQGHSHAFCKCTVDEQYCGHVLNSLGWQQCSSNTDTVSGDYGCTAYDNNTLYLCTNGGVNVIAIEACNGECIGGMTGRSSCIEPCEEGKFYCGHLLRKKGLRRYDDDAIYVCDEAGQLRIVTTCSDHGCHQYALTAACACVPGRYYCGHQLHGKYNLWANIIGNIIIGDRVVYVHGVVNGLFKCEDYGRSVTLTVNCSTCLTQQMDTDSFCPCTPENVYCGNLLNDRGMKDCSRETMPFHDQCRKYTNDTAYRCRRDGRHAAQMGQKHESCQECTLGCTYCGHQLQRRISVQQDQLNELFLCSGNSNEKLESIAHCIKCIKGEPNSYCICIPGSRYCGHWLIQNGYLDYDNHTVYSCSNDYTPGAVIETCSPGECMQGNHYGYCPCTPGKLYCGHELYEHYNEPNTFLTTSVIYECSSDRKRVNINVTCTHACISFPARCKKPCVPQRHYCGSDLTQEEGWEDEALLQDSLYQCFHETAVTQIQNCTDGCETVSGGGATCRAAPTPWYWFFMATTLPMVFLSLAGLVIRGLVRYRRLKKFLLQHRIDFSHLTLNADRPPLGSGHFGEVWKATYRNDKNQLLDVALKICNPSADHPAHGLIIARCFFQETIALEFLKHKNITKVYGVCLNFRLNAGEEITPALVMEFMNGGSAIQYVKDERHRLVHHDLVHIFWDVCQAGKHLHKVRVIHRDIGARNVLIRKDPLTGRPVTAKLTDFGLAKDLGQSTDVYTSTHGDQVFPMRYTAPEGFNRQFSSKSDVWSFGVFMWEVYMLMEDPDPGDDQDQPRSPVPWAMFSERAEVLEALRNGRRLMQPDTAPRYMYTIMKHCWETEPDQRPTFSELVSQFQSNRNYAYHEPITAPIAGPEEQGIIVEEPPDPAGDPTRDTAPQQESTVGAGGLSDQNQNQRTSAQQANVTEEASDEPLNTLADSEEDSDDEGGQPGTSHCGAGNRLPNLSDYMIAAIQKDY